MGEPRETDPVVDRLKARREHLGLSLCSLAKLCKVHKSALSKMERGESSPTLRTIRAIAEALEYEIVFVDSTYEPPPDDRDPLCIEQWPDCYNGEYHPSCCRWPKSCSC